MSEVIAVYGIISATALSVVVACIALYITWASVDNLRFKAQQRNAHKQYDDRLHSLLSELSNIDRWCAESPQVVATAERIKDHVTNGKWESIDEFRSRIRAMKAEAVTK